MIRAQSRLAPPQFPNILNRLRLWAALARQRKALATLDNVALYDLGLTREDADREANRPFWDAPDNWRV